MRLQRSEPQEASRGVLLQRGEQKRKPARKKKVGQLYVQYMSHTVQGVPNTMSLLGSLVLLKITSMAVNLAIPGIYPPVACIPAYMRIHVGTPQGSSLPLHLWGGAWGGVSVPLPSHTWCTLPHEPQRCSLCGWNCELWGEGDTFGCIYTYMKTRGILTVMSNALTKL